MHVVLPVYLQVLNEACILVKTYFKYDIAGCHTHN